MSYGGVKTSLYAHAVLLPQLYTEEGADGGEDALQRYIARVCLMCVNVMDKNLKQTREGVPRGADCSDQCTKMSGSIEGVDY